MSSRIGRALQVQLFGESHGEMVGVTLDGLPAGLALDQSALRRFVSRRAARGSELATARRESDEARVVSGFANGVTTGYPLTALFENADTHSSDYGFLPDRPRPGHADYPAYARGGGFDDLRGSGHHSGRLTLPYVFAGAVAVAALQKQGIEIAAHLFSVENVKDAPLDPLQPDMAALAAAREREIPVLDAEAGERMRLAVLDAKNAADSVGGVVEAVATGLPAGLGAPYFEGVEAVVARHLFSIPAVKGVEFGTGFEAARLRGSLYNDPYAVSDGRVITTQNRAGGLLGGLSNGMPVIVRAAFRPTASIARAQQTISMAALRAGRDAAAELTVRGRHDPCVAIRAVPVVESALALALYDLWLLRNGDRTVGEAL